ncbi:thiamine pyrophosphate-binding protein [Bradyrhizobium sp. 188]|uniref:thiamine pyrophosphate-binding protein n=1 Tax=Bradyrhizobium sp. 188 TaxID=2782656 RepID=UPI001FF742E7|nr:thiamine pyrophosphate-binding protein [Bradyrhizobium sp. 188]MCK1503345.1 pyruvate decarboxylase [Bradyrhizobium sp. 188]
MKKPSRTAAHALLETLVQRGVDRAFCVPGESYIALLDAIHDRPGFDLVTCRHEGGAGFMAVADARLTGRPGVVLVSRGPGASNAAIAIHAAEQDAVPLILIVGQVESRDTRRNAFQEIDYKEMFGSVAKWVGEARHPEEMPELAARAWNMATQGVPGPVVLSIPEDILAAPCESPTAPMHASADAGLTASQVLRIAEALNSAKQPILLAGREFDVPGGRESLLRFAETSKVPVAVSFRRQDLFPNDHVQYIGDMGLSNPETQRLAFAEADLVLALGTRLADITTQGYTWPTATQTVVHTSADPRFLGWRIPATIASTASAPAVVEALREQQHPTSGERTAWIRRLRAIYEADSQIHPKSFTDGLDFLRIVRLVGDVVSRNAIVTLDAGTFAAPFYRKLRWRSDQRLLAPVSGAMGFGVPAAVAAALRHPEKTVICVVGDGGVLMTGNEFAVSVARKLPIKVIISENNSYGSIRVHQERAHPRRICGTDLINPDLQKWAASFGVPVIAVQSVSDIEALAAALVATGPAIALVKTSLEAVLPASNVLKALTGSDQRSLHHG